MTSQKLGPTGRFPEGKLNQSDEGELRFKVSSEGDVVRIDFSTPVVWFGMRPKQAVELAELILRHAREVAYKTGEILKVRML